MSLFEFLMVFVSIIVGLGVTEILTGLARQIRYRETIAHYWLHTVAVTLIFIALLQNWWELWDRRVVEQWTFYSLILMLIPPASLYLIAHLGFPEPVKDSDLKRYYYQRLRPVWLLALIAAASSTLFGPIAFGAELFRLDNLSSGVLLLGFLVLTLLPRNELLHSLLIPAFLALLLWDIVRWHPVFSSV